MNAADETAITDIEIGPDGRIYLFGASKSILELIHDLGLGDPHLQTRIDAMSESEKQQSCGTVLGRKNRQ